MTVVDCVSLPWPKKREEPKMDWAMASEDTRVTNTAVILSEGKGLKQKQSHIPVKELS